MNRLRHLFNVYGAVLAAVPKFVLELDVGEGFALPPAAHADLAHLLGDRHRRRREVDAEHLVAAF